MTAVKITRLLLCSVLAACSMSFGAKVTNEPVNVSRELLDKAGIPGGLVVHVGCGSGALTRALRHSSAFVVHGLDTSWSSVHAAREATVKTGSYGPVSFDHWSGERLPYASELVNMLVIDGQDCPPHEIRRVLAPDGVAMIRRAGTWERLTKARPHATDEWTHFLYDAGNNAVSRDSLVRGPPRRMRWAASPTWARHHDHLPSMSAMVSSNGRVFYIMDEGPKESILLPARWLLRARDAYNGVNLWKRPIERWHHHLWSNKSGPSQMPRRLVAMGDTVYTALAFGGPVAALDARTGTTLCEYEGTDDAEEILRHGRTLLVMTGAECATRSDVLDTINDGVALEAFARQARWDASTQRTVVAVDAFSKKTRWKIRAPIAPLTLATDGERVYFQDDNAIRAVRVSNGKRVWRTPVLDTLRLIEVGASPILVVAENTLFFSHADTTLVALDPATGDVLWRGTHPGQGYATTGDILVADGLVYTADVVNGRGPGTIVGRVPRTGAIARTFAPDIEIDWFHHRCYRNKGVPGFLLLGRTGVEFVNIDSEHWDANHWVRGGCAYGIMPANGLLYTPPHPCVCFAEAKLAGFCALAPGERSVDGLLKQEAGKTRFEKGPAYDTALADAESLGAQWPTYRHDRRRSGAASCNLTQDTTVRWRAELGGAATAPVIADSLVLVAIPDRHAVVALDAMSGRKKWTYVAGGRVDSPPTVYRGRAIFGCRDGYVYCLRMRDGARAWRFRGAPIDQRIVVDEQLESVWPVHGSVLVDSGLVHCVAGRSMFLDGGMRLLALDAVTGTLVREKILDDRHPDNGKDLQTKVRRNNMPVALPDILSSDGRYLYMRSQVFTYAGERLHVEARAAHEHHGDEAHLFSPIGFLDDAWFHRPFWIYGRSYFAGGGAHALVARYAPTGRIMSFDNEAVYSYGSRPEYFRWTTTMEYRLHAMPLEAPLDTMQLEPRPITKIMGWREKTMNMTYPSPLWSHSVPVLVMGMVASDSMLVVAGPPDLVDEEQAIKALAVPATKERLARQAQALQGREGGVLRAVAKSDGRTLTECRIESPPVFDGMAAAYGRLYVTAMDSTVCCIGGGI